MTESEVFEAALKAHGLQAVDCLARRITGETISFVTTGGQKIRWTVGEQPVEIPAHQHPKARPVPWPTRGSL